MVTFRPVSYKCGEVMIFGISARRVLYLSSCAIAAVGLGVAVFLYMTKPPELSFEEVLWVKKGERYYAPGSKVSLSVVSALEYYVDDEEFTFRAPILFLADNYPTSRSNSPLLLSPFKPPTIRVPVDDE